MKKHISNNYLVLALYVASIFYSLHYALTLYLASSFIERYTGLEKVGLVYTFASILSIYFVFSISGLLNKFSNYKIMMSTLLLEIFVLLVLSISNSALLAIPFFVIQQILISIFFFSINIALSEVSKRKEAGSVRGVYFTVLSFGILVAAFFSGLIFSIGSYSLVYMVSAFLLIPVLYITQKYLHSVEEPLYKKISFWDSLKKIYKNKDVYDIMVIYFIVGCFYTIMVLYTTPYLRDVIGIPVTTILKVIMPVALFPFVIFPYELGVLADKKIGEKELIILGLIITSLSVFFIPLIHTANVLVWAGILFATRVGISIVDSMSSVYFHKKVGPDNAGVEAIFISGVGSLATIIMPVVTFVLLSIFNIPVYSIYILLSLLVLFGLKYAIRLHDTL